MTNSNRSEPKRSNILLTITLGGASLLATGAATGAASAATDVLVRQPAPFEACVDVQDRMMVKLGVEPETLAVEMDTGAMLMRKYSSIEANLVLVCNRVTEMLEVRRETPGDLNTAAAQ